MTAVLDRSQESPGANKVPTGFRLKKVNKDQKGSI